MLLLTNGTIATMDPARPMAEAAVVDGANRWQQVWNVTLDRKSVV